MHEASWVRSIYLYVMCAVSIALIGFGAVGSVVGLVHTVAPDLGHRDTLDRVGIGLANIASSVVDLVGDSQGGGAEDFCRDVSESQDDFDACVEEEQSFGGGGDQMAAIQDGIAEVKDELRTQIRNSSLDQMIKGILLVGAGLLLFRIHSSRTELFADGLMPSRGSPPSDAPIAPASPEPRSAPLPPPPGAP